MAADPPQAPGLPFPRLPATTRDALAWLVVAAIVPLATVLAPPVLILRSGADHALLDLATALTACFCSLQAFVRYQSRPQPMFLWLGAGFLASGLLDGLHAIASLQGNDDPGNLGLRSWVASTTVLGLYLAVGLARHREPATPRGARAQELLVGAITVIGLGVLLVALTQLPPTLARLAAFPLHRPYELLPTIVMAVVCWEAWGRQADLDAPLRRRLGLALALYLTLHGGVMAWSVLPLDKFVAMSHLAKFVAHWLIAVGLLESSASLLAEAEGTGKKLAAQTEKLAAQEQKIQQALTLTTMILDHTSVAIYSTDPAGVVTRFNQTAQSWLGYTEAEVCGRLTPAAFHDRAELKRYSEHLVRAHDIPLTSGVDTLLALPRRSYPEHREWTLVRKDGSRFPASVSVVPLQAHDGTIHGFVLVANDLSHQKEVELLKNEFVSTVSHELRTPLTSIRGSLGLLAGGVAGAFQGQAKSLLDIAQRNAERLILLVNDILDMEKIEAGKMRFTLKSVDVDILAAEAVQTAEGLAATRSVKLVRSTTTPGLRVQADEQRLLQVMANLLSNAIKFSPEGGTVEVAVDEHEGQARVRVTDHGPGIPEAGQARIFQKFYQADSSSAREKGGTGLGLSICKALVERMDGRLSFTSQPGNTVFQFTLPEERGLGTAPGTHSELPVLVVDDDFAMGELLRRLLEDIAPVTVARTLAQGRELIAQHRFALAILDIGLPDGSGTDLISALRASQPGTPILVFSEHSVPVDAASQVEGVLSKSRTSLDDLAATVRHVIAAQEQRTHVHDEARTHPAG